MRRLHHDGPPAAAGEWAIVLAGGDGQRLAPLTRMLHGRPLAKQYAVLEGRHSLLQTTLARVTRRIPAERVVVVAGTHHERIARRQLAAWPGIDLVLQPRNLGTGPGLLLPLARVRARAPYARVAIFPSDHFLEDARPFLAAVDRAFRFTAERPERLVLLGVRPDSMETEYGWVLPALFGNGLGDSACRDVASFVEKPDLERARLLQAEGALWNTFVMVGRVETFWRECREHLPEQAGWFELAHQATPDGPSGPLLEDLYQVLRPANFSTGVLERSRAFTVLAVEGSGWSDWGSPGRVYATLRRHGTLDALLRRCARRRDAAAELPTVP